MTWDLAFGDTSEAAAKIRALLGVGPYERVEAVAPLIERPEGGLPPWTPKTVRDLDDLKTLSDKALRFLCLKQWNAKLWLYPGEWFLHLPEGYPVVDISGRTKQFHRVGADKHTKEGCLPYGFVREADHDQAE